MCGLDNIAWTRRRRRPDRRDDGYVRIYENNTRNNNVRVIYVICMLLPAGIGVQELWLKIKASSARVLRFFRRTGIVANGSIAWMYTIDEKVDDFFSF